jgi:transposase
MSLRPYSIAPVSEGIARIARAAFPEGHLYLTLRETLGTIGDEADFATLLPACGQPSLSPWRLALVTIWQTSRAMPVRIPGSASIGSYPT